MKIRVNELITYSDNLYNSYKEINKEGISKEEFKVVYLNSLSILLDNLILKKQFPYVIIDIDGKYSLFSQICTSEKHSLVVNIFSKEQIKYLLNEGL